MKKVTIIITLAIIACFVFSLWVMFKQPFSHAWNVAALILVGVFMSSFTSLYYMVKTAAEPEPSTITVYNEYLEWRKADITNQLSFDEYLNVTYYYDLNEA